VQYIQADLRESSEVERLLDLSRSGFGAINTALCHAGVVTAAPVIDFPEQEWERTMDVNLKSAFLLGSRAAKMMMRMVYRGNSFSRHRGLVGRRGPISVPTIRAKRA
jgi:NAD(P)-dependent dehydrogenase (short-subunit alcohol dehydrogenase family)